MPTATPTPEPTPTPLLEAGQVILSELVTAAPGQDAFTGCEFVEFRGVPNAVTGNYTYLDIEGDIEQNPGVVNNIISLQGMIAGNNGLIVLTNGSTCRSFDPQSTVITDPSFLSGFSTTNNGSNTFIIVSGQTSLTRGQDADANNDGVLDDSSLVTFDGYGTLNDTNALDVLYGLLVLPRPSGLPSGQAINAATRFCSNFNRNSAVSWYFGDLDGVPSTPQYSPRPTSRSANFPSGGLLTPGGLNVGGPSSPSPTPTPTPTPQARGMGFGEDLEKPEDPEVEPADEETGELTDESNGEPADESNGEPADKQDGEKTDAPDEKVESAPVEK